MASNSIDSRHVDQAITGFLGDAGQDESVLIADAAVPEIQVDSKHYSGLLYTLPISAYLGDGSKVSTDALKMAPHDPFPEIFADYNPTKTNYECVARGGKGRKIADAEAARWDFPVTQIQQWTVLTRRTLRMAFEYDTLAQLFSTSNWSNAAIGALTGGTQIAWNVAGSTPIEDGLAIAENIRSASGVKPDYGVISYDVLKALRVHQQTRRVLGTPGQGLASNVQLFIPDADVLRFYAEAWGLTHGLFVEQALYNANNPGQSASVTEMSSGKVFFGCRRGGLGGAGLRSDGVGLLGSGPVSLLRIREYGLTGYSWRGHDPEGLFVAANHSYAYVAPSDMTATAYLVTGVV